MTEMSPQEAAAVWTRVPDVEQELTPRVVGLSNILTGLAIAMTGLPWVVTMASYDVTGTVPWGRVWTTPIVFGAMAMLVLLFLGLRSALWTVYGLARPGGRALLYGNRSYGWWYGSVIILSLVVAWAPAPAALERAMALVPLLLMVYTLTSGHWESKQPWARRPYLLVAGIGCCALGWGLLAADAPYLLWGIHALVGLPWVIAGIALYRQV